jgi:hypothetical protein
MLKKIIIVPILVSLFGCSTIVHDYDSGKMDHEQALRIKKAQLEPGKLQPTPDYVKVADSDGVIVEVEKTLPIKGREGIVLDVWKVTATNHTSTSKCVKIDWRLMDFSFETSQPFEFVLLDHQILKVGKMTQTIWSFDETAVALPPSGYVNKMDVRDANYDKKMRKFTCNMTDDQIDQPK